MRIVRTYEYGEYSIDLWADDDDDIEGRLELTARHAKGMSGITHLPFVVQEFIHPILPGEEVTDAHFICNIKHKFEELVEHVIKLLEDRDWIVRYLEPYLELDRSHGKWEHKC